MTVDEFLKTTDEQWFLTGKKEYSIQAMMVSKETSFHNDLEETDYTVHDDGITVILKGKSGEMYASKLPKVIGTYTKPDGSKLSADDFAEKDVYIDIVTISAPASYYAIHVPNSVSVTVVTAGGDVLHANSPTTAHGDGDYLICRAGKDGEPDLSDVWVFNGVLFPESYDDERTCRRTWSGR